MYIHIYIYFQLIIIKVSEPEQYYEQAFALYIPGHPVAWVGKTPEFQYNN